MTGPAVVKLSEGAPMLKSGDVLSAIKVALAEEPASMLPNASLDVAAAMVMPKVPSPVMELIVTVGVVVVPLLTETVPVAVPVVFRVMSPVVRFTVSAPV